MKNNEHRDELGALARKFAAPYVLEPDTHVCHMPAKSPQPTMCTPGLRDAEEEAA